MGHESPTLLSHGGLWLVRQHTAGMELPGHDMRLKEQARARTTRGRECAGARPSPASA